MMLDKRERFPAGPLLRDLMLHRVDARQWLLERGRGDGIDTETYTRSSAALQHFYRGAYLFEQKKVREAAASWQEALRAEPQNLYYRSILGGS